MSAPEEDKLVIDLREESLSAQQVAWGRADGGQDYAIAAQLADAAADRIEEQASRIATLEAEKAKAEAERDALVIRAFLGALIAAQMMYVVLVVLPGVSG